MEQKIQKQEINSDDPTAGAEQSLHFDHHHAFIIGIDAYQKVSPLVTAISDAKKIAEVLREKHHFQVHTPLLDATRSSMHQLLQTTMREMVQRNDRVVFYFAGHGIATDGDNGPAGYLAPVDADPADLTTFISMNELRSALNALPCRHLLVIMDCCFSGAFKWSSGTRDVGFLMPKQIFKERFDRFVLDPAWQVITSAAYDQKAMDSMVDDKPTGNRGMVTNDAGENHSPFAFALFQALAGEADATTGRGNDGLITATELYSYVRDQVEPSTIEEDQKKRQTPGFFPLSKHDKGEFIFLHPKHRLNLPPRPSRSPYKGLLPYIASDHDLFYGRSKVIRDLKNRLSSHRIVMISGASGSGKSSVVKAGLVPWLKDAGHQILPIVQPGALPLAELKKSISNIEIENSVGTVLIVDQLEEVFTICRDQSEREDFLTELKIVAEQKDRIHYLIITVRSDFEFHLKSSALKEYWSDGSYNIPAFSLEELKEAALMPTMQEVLIFDPPDLLDSIVGEVMQSPGAVPLLSNTLDLLYHSYNSSGRIDRALTRYDYEKLGGVLGIMHTTADALYESLSTDCQVIMRKIFLRMVTVEGDLEGRKVPIEDLNYSEKENLLVGEVIESLVKARLIVIDSKTIETAHYAFVRTWKPLLDWIRSTGRDTLLVGERLSQQAEQYAQTNNAALLWNENPNLANAAQLLHKPYHIFNEQEIRFVRKSLARNLRKSRIIWSLTIATIIALSGLTVWAFLERDTAEKERASAVNERLIAQTQRDIAQKEKERAILSLFEGLKLNMKEGFPGSVCTYGLCVDATMGIDLPGDDQNKWQSLGMLPISTPSYFVKKGKNIAYENDHPNREFVVARQFGDGHVLAYAHDGLTRDREITDDSDNLLFAQNALAWLTSRNGNKDSCTNETVILVWEGAQTFVKLHDMEYVQYYVESRGWKIKPTTAEKIEKDLECASVFWYLSDWAPPENFSSQIVPTIVNFVRQGGGLLMGGLGWSYAGQYRGADTLYSGDALGKPFGLSFTLDYFDPDRSVPIQLMQKE